MKNKSNRGETDVAFTVIMSIVVLLGLIGLGITCKEAGNKLEKMGGKSKELHTETILLQSINATTRVSGSFTYGIGTINQKDYYVTYQVLEDGGKQIYKMPAEKTVIYETLESGSQAYVEEDVNGYGSVTARRLYVPTGSIEQKYDLTLE